MHHTSVNPSQCGCFKPDKPLGVDIGMNNGDSGVLWHESCQQMLLYAVYRKGVNVFIAADARVRVFLRVAVLVATDSVLLEGFVSEPSRNAVPIGVINVEQTPFYALSEFLPLALYGLNT